MKKMYIKSIFSCLFLSLCAGLLLAQDNNTDVSDQGIDSTLFPINKGGKVRLPFDRTSEYETTTGSVWVISPEEIMSYDNIQDVSDALYGRVPGMRGTNIREFGEALTIIDGVPRPLSSVTLQEIQQITVLKDINASILYGVQAANGVILVTTKRGQITGPGTKVSAWVEYGMDKPISYPTFLNAADYMELYNEARLNDGLPEKFTPEDIEATRAGTNPLRYPDVDYFNSTFLKRSRPMSRAVTDFTGGNENAQYYVNAGFMHSGGLLKLGHGSDEQANRINLRSNINFRINDFIKSHLDIAAIYDDEKSARGDFWGNASSLRPELFPLLIDTSLVASPGATKLINGRYLLGGTSQYRNNVYGDLYLGGYSNTMNTTAQFTNGIDFDLRSVTEGLSLSVLGSFDFFKRFREYQSNEYAVYELDWTNGTPDIGKIGDEQFTGTQSLDNTLIRRSYGFNGILNYHRTFAGKHAVSASAIAFMNRVRQTHPNILYDDKYSHLAMNVNYAYDRKYIVDFSSALIHSVKLPRQNRTGLSPSLAVGWVASHEDFLKNSAVLDFLKVRASAGILNTDMAVSESYLYQDLFANSGSYGWNDGVRSNQKTVFQNVGNSDLSFEKKLDLNVGVEAGLLDESLWLDVNVFRNHYAEKILQQSVNYNEYLGGFVPYSNYGKDQYSGVEIGALWSKSSNDFDIDIGINATYMKTKVLQADEIFENDYQYRAGNPVNAIFGLEALGLFESIEDINSHATQKVLGEVQPGDIKYKDQNGDGVVDDNDEIMIGHGTPTLSGGINVRVGYKNFSVFAIATAVQGSDRMYSSEYYWVYGDRKYSTEVLNRWTPQTASTATYPRLTSGTSSNNFRSSSFWLYDNSRVSLNRVQLNYVFPELFGGALGISHLSLYARGSNLVTFSGNSEKMELNIGSMPQYRSYAIGLKAKFH